jgi:NitT/TauT family transport system ATP-binding protein
MKPAMPAACEMKASPPAKLLIEGVSKWFRTPRADVHALDNVNLAVDEGEFICLVGPSGCGKSTLLDIVAGLTAPDLGRVLADDQVVIGPGRHRLVMFQDAALFPWLTVFGNVMFGLKRCPGLTRRRQREIATYYLKLVGLEKFSKSYVHELSGGMRQRVALARSLAPDPRVLLMDEPLAALDALTREQLYFDIQDIWQRQRKTIVLVSHNVREGACLADRVLVMSPSPGRMCEEFRIDLPRPRDVNSPEVAALANTIVTALRGHLKAAPRARDE